MDLLFNCQYMYSDKAVAAEEVMASLALKHTYTFKKSLLDRKSYAQRKMEILEALRAVNAGGQALDLILANKSKSHFPTKFLAVCKTLH